MVTMPARPARLSRDILHSSLTTTQPSTCLRLLPLRTISSSHPKSDTLVGKHPVHAVPTQEPKFSSRTSIPLTQLKQTPLANLPLSQVLRTYLISAISASPILLSICVGALERMLRSRTWITSVDRNPLLRTLLHETFYKQFCAGRDKHEVRECVANMQRTGVSGVVLEYAREVLDDSTVTSDEQADIDAWTNGILSSIEIAKPGDCVAFKWSGMGPAALQLMKAHKPPSQSMQHAMRNVCQIAAGKDILLLPAAEETNTLEAFHEWSISLQRQFNKQNKAIVYTTYQAYLKCTAGYIARHIADAAKHNYVLGAKMVRGAYLGSEPRDKIWETKARTDEEYDSLSAAIVERQYNDHLVPSPSVVDSHSFPQVDLILATHNLASVRKAQSLRDEQIRKLGKPKTALAYAQLQGMADEVSCELVASTKAVVNSEVHVEAPKVYKYMPWGSMTECLTYLLRRASENKEAAGRTRDSRLAMGAELRRRMFGSMT